MASKPKLDVLNEALMSIQERIEKCTAEVQRLKKAEESFAKGMFGLPSSTPSEKQVQDGDPTRQHAPSKTVFKLLGLKKAEAVKKAETYIDEKHPSDREKRYVTKGKPENNLPGDYKAKVSPASQGSDPKVEKVVKDEMGSMKPKMPKGYEKEEKRHDRAEESEEKKHESKHDKAMIKAIKGKKKPCK